MQFGFRPDENYKRFNNSAVRMAMPEVPKMFYGRINQLAR
jgi:branched-chain amino acid aminotransferase